MENKQFEELLTKYRLGQCTEQEKALLESWYLREMGSEHEPLPQTDFQYQHDDLWNRISAGIPETRPVSASLWPRLAAAAAILILISTGIFYFSYTSKKQQPAAVADIAPGKIGATLTLANGKKISLGDAGNGEIARQEGVSVVKAKDGQIDYHGTTNTNDPDQLNTLTTARGETYALTLPDHSKVWLNAASSITFNASLLQDGMRKVKLTGEAYFEISRDESHPFIVESDQQQVRVLGTHFNISAYKDEPVTKTTLLEGSIQVAGLASGASQHKIVMKPGQQAVLSANHIQVDESDTDNAIAWKDNVFSFESEDIRTVMRMIARWYDVEIVYEGTVTEEKFGGGISRFDNVSKVLKSLESTGKVHFKIVGRKIFVSR